MAQRQSAEPTPPWMGDLPVLETLLDNGARVLILPRRLAPVVVVDLYYPAGAVQEPPGKSGLAHFVEHLLFKGTEKYPKGSIDLMTLAAAGQANAETSEDFTHYWFELPSDRWELALEIEADRMTSVQFDPNEVEAERQVIIEERSSDLDTPQGRLEREFQATSYLVHPYRNPVIGWPDDFASITVEDIRDFYQKHYRPENAVLVIVGDVDPSAVRDKIAVRFGHSDLKRDQFAPPPVRTIREPRQQGKRSFKIEEEDGVSRCLMGWHTVPVNHPDAPLLAVASDILGLGRRSRLWDRLIEQDRIANGIDCAHEASRETGQMIVMAEATVGSDPEVIEKAILEEVARLKDEGPTLGELSRSRRKIDASWRWGQQDLSALAAGLGQSAIYGDWRRWRADQRAAMDANADSIRQVVATYLTDRSLTVGWSIPLAQPSESATPEESHEDAERATLGGRGSSNPNIAKTPMGVPTQVKLTGYRPSQMVLSNGLKVVTESRNGSGVVALELHVDAGLTRETKPGLSYMTGRMLEEGAGSRTGQEIAEAIEDVGGALSFGGAGVSIRINAEDLALAIEILGDIVQFPKFPEDVFAWVKTRTQADVKSDQDDALFRAEMVFRSSIYGQHPFGRDPRGTIRQIQSLAIGDLKEHQQHWFVPDNAILAVAGDVDRVKLKSLLERALRTWKPAPKPLEYPQIPAPPVLSRSQTRRSREAGEQVHILMGHLGITRHHPDFAALCVLDHVLGAGVGFADRLNQVLRDEMGLAYSVSGGIAESADLEPGMLRIAISTSPDLVKPAVQTATKILREIHDGQFEDEEVARAIAYLSASWVFDYQSDDQRAERLVDLVRLKLPLDEPKRWPERLEKLRPDDVRRAARNCLRPGTLIRVEVGGG